MIFVLASLLVGALFTFVIGVYVSEGRREAAPRVSNCWYSLSVWFCSASCSMSDPERSAP